MEEKVTFIYCLNDPRDGRLRYVGKADDPYRRWKHHIATAQSKDHRGAWIRSLLAIGLKPELEILEEIPHEGWQEIEKEYIRVFRMVNMNLVNSSNGGESLMEGRTHSLAARAKISAASRNRSPETLAKISLAQKGRIKSPRECENISRAKKNMSPETRARIGASKKGKKYFLGRSHSLESRAKMSASQKGHIPWTLGRRHSEETCAKISLANTGRKWSIESCAKMSASAKKAWILRKQKIKNP